MGRSDDAIVEEPSIRWSRPTSGDSNMLLSYLSIMADYLIILI